MEKETGLPAVIIDGNDINVKMIAMSKGMPVDKKAVRLILLDNPMGQERELTPFILVRKEGKKIFEKEKAVHRTTWCNGRPSV